MTAQFRILDNPSEAQLETLSADGFSIVASAYADGAWRIIMSRGRASAPQPRARSVTATIPQPVPAPVPPVPTDGNPPVMRGVIVTEPTALELIESSVLTRAGGADAYRKETESELENIFWSVCQTLSTDMTFLPLPRPGEGQERLAKEGGSDETAAA